MNFNFIKKTKIFEVFTKEYHKETEINEFLKNNIEKLPTDDYDVNEHVKSLIKKKYKLNFKLKLDNGGEL